MYKENALAHMLLGACEISICTFLFFTHHTYPCIENYNVVEKRQLAFFRRLF